MTISNFTLFEEPRVIDFLQNCEQEFFLSGDHFFGYPRDNTDTLELYTQDSEELRDKLSNHGFLLRKFYIDIDEAFITVQVSPLINKTITVSIHLVKDIKLHTYIQNQIKEIYGRTMVGIDRQTRNNIWRSAYIGATAYEKYQINKIDNKK